MIRYGDGSGAGNGHRIRMQRLARALTQRGAPPDIRPFNFVETLDVLKRKGADVLVTDIPKNDDGELEAFRPYAGLLVVGVGIGHSITADTSWIADVIISQNLRPNSWFSWNPAPGCKMLGGEDYLMVDPQSQSWRRTDPGTECLTYFGAGTPPEYIDDCLQELHMRLPATAGIVDTSRIPLSGPFGRRLAAARLLVCTMGMAVNDALAVGTGAVVISRDNEHERDAIAAALPGSVLSLGQLESISPNELARNAAERYNAARVRPRSRIDGLGVYRVARALLE